MLSSGDKVLLGTAVIIWCGIKQTLKLEVDCGRAGGLEFNTLVEMASHRHHSAGSLGCGELFCWQIQMSLLASSLLPRYLHAEGNTETLSFSKLMSQYKLQQSRDYLNQTKFGLKERLQSALSTAGSQDIAHVPGVGSGWHLETFWTLLLKGNCPCLLRHPFCPLYFQF